MVQRKGNRIIRAFGRGGGDRSHSRESLMQQATCDVQSFVLNKRKPRNADLTSGITLHTLGSYLPCVQEPVRQVISFHYGELGINRA